MLKLINILDIEREIQSSSIYAYTDTISNKIKDILGNTQSLSELNQKIEILKQNNIFDIDINVLRYSKIENLRLIIDKAGIKDNKKLKELIVILRNAELKNLKLIIEEANIKSFEDINFLKILIFLAKPENLRLIIKKAGIIKVKDIYALIGVLKNMDYKILDFIIVNTKIKSDLLDIILQNSEIKTKKFINLEKFKYKRPKVEDLNYLARNKNTINNDTYVDNDTNKVFSLLDIDVDKTLEGKQIKGKEIQVGSMNFFHINNDKEVTQEEQQIINRIFAPFFPMTRVVKLINGKTEFVSINVEDETGENKDIEGKNLCGFKNNINKNIKRFYRIIYQFLAMDFDRVYAHNLTKDEIIYDFDFIFKSDYFGRETSFFYESIFEDKKLFNEFKNIFFLIKNYIHFYCLEEIERLNLLYKDTEDNSLKVKISLLQKLLNREKQFTLTNFISALKIENKEVLNFALNADKEDN